MKKLALYIAVLLTSIQFSAQSIEVVSLSDNPLDVNPLVGATLQVNYKYSSESGATANNIYIALEVLDGQNNYVSTVVEQTLQNKQAGIEISNSVDLFVSSYHKLSAELPQGHYYQVKATLYNLSWTELAWAGHWNIPSLTIINTSSFSPSPGSISRGADVSWMTEMESQGFTWKDNNGTTKELMPLLSEYDINSIRLRVWVDPDNSGANGWCDIDDLVSKAEKAHNQGMDIMICIHYSDWWADPGKQNKPATWENMSVSELETAVASHTTDILTALQVKSITPKWVQIGNETDDGMLWPTGKASEGGFANYAKFLNAGVNAVKSFNNSIQSILHISNGNNNSLYRWNIDGLVSAGVEFNKFDVIGMSLYPDETNWISMVDDAYSNMLDLQSRYGKDVMLVEVGFPNSRPDISYQFLNYAIEKTKQAGGKGVLYWEPIARSGFTNYDKGAWDDDGSPSIAMDAFLETSTLSADGIAEIEKDQLLLYPNPTSSILYFKADFPVEKVEIYDIKGSLIKTITSVKDNAVSLRNLEKGIYLIWVNERIQKMMVKD